MFNETKRFLLICSILLLSHPCRVTAVSDSELEALEKQIEQKEAEILQQTKTDARRKVEAKRKTEETARRKTEDEAGHQSEQHALTGEMIKISGGSFQMGSNDVNDNEKPVHNVTVGDFEMGKYEVTQRQWRDVMGNNPSYLDNCDDCPVETVTWYDVQNFIQKLNDVTGSNFRLPSEAEWEYGCRSGGMQEKYCGGNSPDALAWYHGNSPGKKYYRPVGQKQPNGIGLYDMSGNIREWVEDCYNDNYSGAPTDGSAWLTGPGNCGVRVVRNGTWGNKADDIRSTVRTGRNPSTGSYTVGFRLAMDK